MFRIKTSMSPCCRSRQKRPHGSIHLGYPWNHRAQLYILKYAFAENSVHQHGDSPVSLAPFRYLSNSGLTWPLT